MRGEKAIDAAKRAIKAAEGDEDRHKGDKERKAVEAARKRRRGGCRNWPRRRKARKGPNITRWSWIARAVHLTHEGIAAAQEAAGVGSFYVGNNMEWPHLMEQALRAHVVYEKDKDYVVERGPRGRWKSSSSMNTPAEK
jgi:preprotein translocase subunit SecA